MNAMVQNLKEMGQVKLGILAAVAAVLIGFFIFISMRMSSPTMAPLYSNLPMEDSAKIVEQLETQKVPYEIMANGTQVLVPADQVLRLRMSMAQQGLPTGGSLVGYEIFDRDEALGTSNFIHNVNMLRALEGELARTIASFEQVERARVHLVLPKRELFSRDRQEPTASVALKLKGSSELSKAEIASISHLVATAVPGLKVSGITIVDQRGRMLLKGGEDANDPTALANDAEEYRVAYENRMRRMLEELLARTVGENKVKVQVNADIDFDRIVTNSETFDPESQVARSIQATEESENSNERQERDNVSVANQLPDANASNQQGILSSKVVARTDETTNFEISKVVQNHVKETGTVKRLSVAVLVDGTYAEDNKGDEQYTPRSEEELAKIEQVVKSAVGYDEKRGDTVQVTNLRFLGEGEEMFAEGAFDWLKDDMQGIIQTLMLGGVAVLAILLIIRPLVNRMIEATPVAGEEGEGGETAALGGPGVAGQLTSMAGEAEDDDTLINLDRIQGRVKSGTYRKINELIEKHPEETLTVLRQWSYREA